MDATSYTHFTLRQLANFVAAAERGSLSSAAQHLHVSQSAVSASITELERALGTELTVRRRGLGMTLTPTGRQVLDQSKRLLADAAEIDFAARGHGGELHGPLVVGAYLTLSSTVLPPLLVQLRRRHPNVSVRIVEDAQDALNERLTLGELDLVVGFDHDLPAWVEPIALYTVRPYVLLSADDPLARHETLSMADLDGPPMVLFDAPPSGANAMSIFLERGIVPNIRYRTQTIELTRSLVARGEGYAMLVHRSRSSDSHEGLALIERELDPPVAESRVVLAASRGTAPTARALAFIEIAREHYGAQDPSHI